MLLSFKNPPCPPLKKGGKESCIEGSPPFLKGDLGGLIIITHTIQRRALLYYCESLSLLHYFIYCESLSLLHYFVTVNPYHYFITSFTVNSYHYFITSSTVNLYYYFITLFTVNSSLLNFQF